MPVWLAIAVLAGHAVDVSPETCTSSAAIEAALAPDLSIPLTIQVRPAPGGLRVIIQADGQDPTERSSIPASDPCPLIPDLVAVMAERYVRALPHRAWVPRAPAAPPTPTPRLTLTRTPASRRPSSALELGADLGATVGLQALSPGADVGLHLAWAGPRWGATARAGLRLIPGLAFGPDGTLRVTAPRAGIAAFVRLPPSRALRWEVGLAGGLYLGSPSGFERASSKTLPLLEAHSRVMIELPAGLYAGLGLAIPVVRPQFERATPSIVYREPAVRLSLLVGFARPLAFF